MPEEINRIIADRISTLLFCPTAAATEHLRTEGIVEGVHQCGDVMFDVSLFYRDRARERSRVIAALGLSGQRFALATCHRAENTDDPGKLQSILAALGALATHLPVVFPIHPRTRKKADECGLRQCLRDVTVIEPQPFLDMIALEQGASMILTDSGGVQKEAFFFGVPCLTLRDETEWVETVTDGGNVLVGADAKRILDEAKRWLLAADTPAWDAGAPYGDGNAAQRIVDTLLQTGR